MSSQFMSLDHALLVTVLDPIKTRAPAKNPKAPKLGAYLLGRGEVTPGNLAKALALQVREEARLGDILIANGWVTEEALMAALSEQYSIGYANTAYPPHDKVLIQSLPWRICLKYNVVPWTRSGGMLVLATSNPEQIDDIRAELPESVGSVLFSLASEVEVLKAIAFGHGDALARRAEAETPEAMSCRTWGHSFLSLAVPITGMLLLAAAVLHPVAAVALATALACVLLLCNMFFKGTALWFHLRRNKSKFNSNRHVAQQTKLPLISLFIPLFKEPLIAKPLVQRMARLDYPRELLDICLIVEETDTETRAELARAKIPPWFRVIVVPDGHPRTKPRAMNYALNFARGSIVGVYDAEDAPEARQLHAVADRFATAPPEVVCLQGRLDYYNPRQNWVARCFTIEYAAWFRLFLPAIKRMGLAVPLGGTTLFFKRDVLRDLGGWDAHNVTEDADLGLRLARGGFETEILEVTTLEEANAATLPWIRQRSRWNKGYFMTWVVHNRRPLKLLQDLGFRKWMGFHMMFLGNVMGAILAPFLWSTIGVAFGLWHPILTVVPDWAIWPIAGLFALASLLTLALAVVACGAPHLRFLRPWSPLVLLYYQLSTFSTYKGLFETIAQPFFWDKTSHGHFGGAEHGVEPDLTTSQMQAPILGAPLKDKTPNISPLPNQLAKVPIVRIDQNGNIRRIS